jgi:hypothetical protein
MVWVDGVKSLNFSIPTFSVVQGILGDFKIKGTILKSGNQIVKAKIGGIVSVP